MNLPDDPLGEDDIVLNYTAMGYSEPAVRLALRNAAVLRWINTLHSRPLVAALLEEEYAAWSGLPHAEVVGAMGYVTDQASLDWIYSQYGEDISLLE